ncbi:MAG: S-adenosylmethionine decarboxylase [Pirellulales bacterium]|nr:S-adenosylmethionine decarboxylase [Pirellulales bacterium]
MNKKTRREEPKGPLGRKDSGAIPEAWPKEEPSRHKWFRKRNKGGVSRRSRFDDDFDGESEDEIDDEADEEDAESGPALCESYNVLSAAATGGEEIMSNAVREGVWGIASAIDIYDCDPELIRDADAIRRFVVELCDLIEMKRFGETQVVHFGEDERVAGYSMVQLIETSLISAHFANQTNAVYLDVFSCKPYNPQVVRDFSQAFFRGLESSLQVALRR